MFQSTRLREARRAMVFRSCGYQGFQSTRLREARPVAGEKAPPRAKFQSTRLREARRDTMKRNENALSVSIHAPA